MPDSITNKTTRFSTLASVPLGELLGAPLLALVQGRAQAAQATAEFIEQIGFDAELANNGTLGELRMVSFSYEKSYPGIDQPQTLQVSIPLLSLVTVPNIQVKKALLEYAIKITGIQTKNSSTSQVELQSVPGTINEPTSTNVQMKITMNAGQASVPAGIVFLENIMEQSVKQQ